jgi:hypothetical protein
MRLNQEDTSAFNTNFKSGKYSHSRKVLSGNLQITLNGSIVNALDPGGADRIAFLPPEEAGRFYVVANIGTANNILVQSFGGAVTLNTLGPGETTTLFSSVGGWVGANAPLDLHPFGPTGPNHSEGLVPDPGIGPVDPNPANRRFLGESGWQTVTSVTVGTDYFYGHRGGGVTITPLGAETVEFLSANTAISILAQAGTSPKSMKFTLNASNIDHNALLNYSANQHVDHTAVTLTAGLGISGGGTIAASRTFDFAPTELTIATPGPSDYLVWDLAAGGPRKGLLSGIATVLDHNTLFNFVANKHIDHSTVSIVASTGLNGGGDLTASRSFSLSINSLAADVPAVGDSLVFYDVSQGDHNSCTITTLNGTMDHNALLNYVPLQHVNHSSVLINTANGIQGGGDITATRTLSLDNPVDGTTYARKNNAWQALVNITVSSTAPSSPAVNDVWIDTT